MGDKLKVIMDSAKLFHHRAEFEATELAKPGPADEDDGEEDGDVGADAQDGGEPGVAVHQVPQAGQGGRDVQGGRGHLEGRRNKYFK